jgi:citrate synthase
MDEEDTWETRITDIEPNIIIVACHPLQDLIGKCGLLEAANLLVTGEFPSREELARLENIARKGARAELPQTCWDPKEDVSKAIARSLMVDNELIRFHGSESELTAFTLGRTALYIAWLFDNIPRLSGLDGTAPFSRYIWTALTGRTEFDEKKARLFEAMMVASVDHGVTPPSAQATIIAATARTSYEVAVAQGVGVITDVHGGAGMAAAELFAECVERGAGGDLETAIKQVVDEYMASGKRIKGLGHRIHSRDPRRDAIWALAEESGVAGRHVEASKLIGQVFKSVKGKDLPINVDGVIGAVVADLGLEPVMAKVIFIYGRIAGLSAHYFEEVATQKPMRKVDFTKAVYSGPR